MAYATIEAGLDAALGSAPNALEKNSPITDLRDLSVHHDRHRWRGVVKLEQPKARHRPIPEEHLCVR
jgi:hypothetical protein